MNQPTEYQLSNYVHIYGRVSRENNNEIAVEAWRRGMSAVLEEFQKDFPAPAVPSWRPYSEIGKTGSDPIVFLTTVGWVIDNEAKHRSDSGETKFTITHFLTKADVLQLPRPAVKTEREIAEEEFEVHWSGKGYKAATEGRLYAFNAWMAAKGFAD